METCAERRRRKLNDLIQQHGLEEIAKRTGLNSASLDHIAKGRKSSFKRDNGSYSERSLGDLAARAIEDAFQLGRGWLDNDEDEMLTPVEREIVSLYQQLDKAKQRVIRETLQEARDRQEHEVEQLRKALSVTPKAKARAKKDAT